MPTPNDLQTQANAVPWTNAQKLITGGMLSGLFATVIGIFATMGAWLPSGYRARDTALINGMQPAVVATTGSASDIKTGTLPRAQLPVLIPQDFAPVQRYEYSGDGTNVKFFTSSTTDLTFAQAYIDGLLQQSSTWTSDGAGTLTFISPPPFNSTIQILSNPFVDASASSRGSTSNNATPSGPPQQQTFMGDGVTTQFPLNESPINLDRFRVFIGGVEQPPQTCLLSNQYLTCVAPPPPVAIRLIDGP